MERLTMKQMIIMESLREMKQGNVADIAKKANLSWSVVNNEMYKLWEKRYVKGVQKKNQSLIYGIDNSKKIICGINVTDENVVITFINLYFEIEDILIIKRKKNIYETIYEAINEASRYYIEKECMFNKFFVTTAEDVDLNNDLDAGIEIISPIDALLYATKTIKKVKSVAYMNSTGVTFATQVGNEKIISQKSKINITNITTLGANNLKDTEKILNLFMQYLSFVGNDKLYLYSNKEVCSHTLSSMINQTMEKNIIWKDSIKIEENMKKDCNVILALGAAVWGYYNNI